MNSTPLSLQHCIQQKQSARVGSDVSCDLGVLEELLNATCVQMLLCGCGEVLKNSWECRDSEGAVCSLRCCYLSQTQCELSLNCIQILGRCGLIILFYTVIIYSLPSV